MDEKNYIDHSLTALRKLRDILTAHGIQITNVVNAEYATVDFRSGLTGVGLAEGVHPKLTVEVYVPLD